jgi:dihydroneopterin aldolase
VQEVSDARAYHLLEALATAVADELMARFPVERVTVRVRKPDVVLDPPVKHVAVRATRP